MADEVLDTLALEVTTTAGGAAKGLNDLATSISNIARSVGEAYRKFSILNTVIGTLKTTLSDMNGPGGAMVGTFIGNLADSLGRLKSQEDSIGVIGKVKRAISNFDSEKLATGTQNIIALGNALKVLAEQGSGALGILEKMPNLSQAASIIKSAGRISKKDAFIERVNRNISNIGQILDGSTNKPLVDIVNENTGIGRITKDARESANAIIDETTRIDHAYGKAADSAKTFLENGETAFEKMLNAEERLFHGRPFKSAMTTTHATPEELLGISDGPSITRAAKKSARVFRQGLAYKEGLEYLRDHTIGPKLGTQEFIDKNLRIGEGAKSAESSWHDFFGAEERAARRDMYGADTFSNAQRLMLSNIGTRFGRYGIDVKDSDIAKQGEEFAKAYYAELQQQQESAYHSVSQYKEMGLNPGKFLSERFNNLFGGRSYEDVRSARQAAGIDNRIDQLKEESAAAKDAAIEEKRLVSVREQVAKLEGATPAELANMKLEGARGKLQDAVATGADKGTIAARIEAVQKAQATVTQEMQKQQAEAQATADGIGKVKNETDQAVKPAGMLRNALREAGNSIKTAFRKSIFGQFFRMAKMRAMRYAIRAIAKGIKEGVTNMYQWSKALGGDFAKSMDAGASQVLLLKNSLGTMFAPILQSLIPVLTDVVGWVNTAASSINQLFAILAGRSTWTRATLSATEYAQATKDASGSTKDLLADWDELNVIQGQSGNGNNGKKNPNYSEMFEEVDTFDENIKNLGTWLKENMDLILSVVKDIGIAIAGWKIAAGLGGFISSLGLAEETALRVRGVLTGLRDIAIGAISLVISFKLSVSAGQEIAQEGFSAGAIIKSIGGLIAGALGGKFLVGGLFKMFGIAGGGVTGAILGLTFALGVTLVSYLNTKNAKLKEQTEKFLRDNVPSYKEATLWVEYTNALIANRAQIMEKINQQLESIGLVRDKLTLGIDVENSKARLAEQIKELVGYIGELFNVSQAMAKNEMNSGFISEETYTQYLTLNGQLFAEIQKLGDTIGGILTGAIEDSLLENGQSLLQTSLDLMDQITAALHAKEDTKTQLETAREIMKETDPTKVREIMGEKYNEMYEAAYKQMIDEYSSFVAEMKMAQIFAEAHPEDEAAQRRYQGYVELYESGEFRPSSAKADKRAKESLGNVVSELGDYLSYIFLNDKSNPYTGTSLDEKSPWYTGAYQEYVKPFINSVKTNPYLTLPSDLRDNMTDDEKFEQGYKYLSSIVENIVGKDYFDEFIASGGKLADLFSEELKQELSKNLPYDENLFKAMDKGFDPGNGSHILRWIDLILDPELYARYKEFMSGFGTETEGAETEVSAVLKETAETVSDDVEIYMEDIIEPAIEEAAEIVKESAQRNFKDAGASGVAGTDLYQNGNPELATKKNSLYDALREEALGRPSNLNFNGATSGWESTKPEPLTEELKDIFNDPEAKADFDYAVDRIRELYEVWYDGYNPAKAREGMDWNDSDAISNFMRENFLEEVIRVIDENRRLSDIIDYILDYERNPRDIHGLSAPNGYSVSGAAVNQGSTEMNATMAGGFASLVERLNALVPYLSNIQAATQETARKKFSVNVTPSTTLGRVVTAAASQLERVTGDYA